MRKLQAVPGEPRDPHFLPVYFTGAKKLSNVTPDEPDIHGEVQRVLDESPVTKRMKIRVENADGVIVLRGKVTTYYAKQLVQEVIRPVLAKCNPHPVLRNAVEVASPQG
mgnify:CR=1 FL=1